MFIGAKLGIIFVLPKNVLIKNSFSFDLAQNNRKSFVNCILYCNRALRSGDCISYFNTKLLDSWESSKVKVPFLFCIDGFLFPSPLFRYAPKEIGEECCTSILKVHPLINSRSVSL